MFTFRDSIKVPKSIYMGGQVNALTYEDGDFKFIIDGDPVAIINVSGISGGGDLSNDVLFVDEENKRIGINVSEPIAALDVDGDEIVRANLFVSGALSAQTLVFEDGDIDGELTVSGGSTLYNEVIVPENLSVSGILRAGVLQLAAGNAEDLVINGTLDILGQLAVTGTHLVGGNTQMSGSFIGLFSSATIASTGSLSLSAGSGSIQASGGLSVAGGLDVVGDSTFANRLTVSGISELPAIVTNKFSILPLTNITSTNGAGVINTTGLAGVINITVFNGISSNDSRAITLNNTNIGPFSNVYFYAEWPYETDNANVHGIYIDVMKTEQGACFAHWYNSNTGPKGPYSGISAVRVRWQIQNPI